MNAHHQKENGWNPRKRRTQGAILPHSEPRWKYGPVIAIKTLCATKGQETFTATWHNKDGFWTLVSFHNPLAFLKGCDECAEAEQLLATHGWLGKWHDSSMQLPVPMLELENQNH